MPWFSWLLLPFALIYELVTRFRNYLYDKGVLKSTQFETNVISVGNLSVGGTGKTPLIEYLIRLISDETNHVTTLSRGYGRKTFGFIIAGENDDANSIGDEPYMYHKKFGNAIGVAVCKNRDLAIPEILIHRPETNVILLDDAYQHRIVKPSLSILLTNFSKPFYSDFVLPVGRLREIRAGAKRADIIVVTKCPTLSESDQVKIKSAIHAYASCPVFFSEIGYDHPKPIFKDQPPLKNRVIGISGIAHPIPFNRYLQKNYSLKFTHNYRDHHRFTELDVQHIINELDDHTSLICTEKDAVKLEKFEILSNYSVYYLPITTQFLKEEALFQAMIKNSLKSFDFL
ncbi:MAG: tetraacyldisaccharide 4'-kinase [Cyclobacteriaceae bacterium]